MVNARVLVIALFAVARRLVPLQTSPSRCLLWCFRRNRVKKSRSPHSGCSCRRIPLHESRPRQPYALATSINDCQVRIRANHSARPSKWEHSARSALGCRCNTFLSIFQCIELPPVMTSYAIPVYPVRLHWPPGDSGGGNAVDLR